MADIARGGDGVEFAAALFDIFVRPRPRGRANDEELSRVLTGLWDGYGTVGRAIVTRVVRSGVGLELGDATWCALFDRALAAPSTAPQPRSVAAQPPPWPDDPDRGRPLPRPSKHPDFRTRRMIATLAVAWAVAVAVIVLVSL
jgi:hypothetical protein